MALSACSSRGATRPSSWGDGEYGFPVGSSTDRDRRVRSARNSVTMRQTLWTAAGSEAPRRFRRRCQVTAWSAGWTTKLVAQSCTLPYRRIVFCGASPSPSPLGLAGALPIGNRRSSRLKICATVLRSICRQSHGLHSNRSNRGRRTSARTRTNLESRCRITRSAWSSRRRW